MTRAPSRRVASEPRPGRGAASQAVAQHGAPRAATGGDERRIRERSDVDLCVRLERIAELHVSLADEYRQIADDIQLAVTDERALMDGMASRRLFSVRNLADFLDVDEKTVRRWREAGKLPPALEVGGIVRWRPEVVSRWLEEQES